MQAPLWGRGLRDTAVSGMRMTSHGAGTMGRKALSRRPAPWRGKANEPRQTAKRSCGRERRERRGPVLRAPAFNPPEKSPRDATAAAGHRLQLHY